MKLNWSRVDTWRNAGVDARWGKVKGRPSIFLRPSHSKSYYLLDNGHYEAIQNMVDRGETIGKAVDIAYSVADIFHI